jgi:multidrug transporter EmrE-like cation transporter
MTYVALALAIVFEAGWALALKASDGFTRPVWAGATAVMYIASVLLLGVATRKMDIGVAYAMWAGAGIVLIALGGAVWFKEPMGMAKVACIALILVGIAGLHVLGSKDAARGGPPVEAR